MKHLLICFCIVFSSMGVVSKSLSDSSFQDKNATPHFKPNLILKFAPLSLLDIYSAIQFAVEYKVGSKSTLQLEAGYIFPIDFEENTMRSHYKDMRGYRIRSEYRYYIVVNKYRTGGLYIAPELFFVNLNYNRVETFRVSIDAFRDFYYQEITYDIDKTIFGYHAKIGYQTLLSERFVFDVYAGLGARHVAIDSKEPGLNGEIERVSENDFFFNEDKVGRSHRPSISLGFKVGILLK